MPKLSFKEWVAVTIGVVFVAYMLFGGSIASVFRGNTAASVIPSLTDNSGEVMQNQVKTEDLAVGTGQVIAPGMVVSVNYVLSLEDGTLIQDSKQVAGGEPFKFVLGAGQLIPGWEMGITGMKVGGKRLITIPPELGYGTQQSGPIPPNSTLIFAIEVLASEPLPQTPQAQ